MAKSKPAPVFPRQLKSLLTALQGARFTSAITRPQVMLSSLTSMQTFPRAKATKAGLAMPLTADIWTFCRKIENTGCEKRAQIVATYSNEMPPGEKLLGEPAVTALLNLAAAQRCADSLDCPSRCPASYTERKKLYWYRFFGASESGVLTIPEAEWNCRCLEISE